MTRKNRTHFLLPFLLGLFLLLSACRETLVTVTLPADLAEEPMQELLDADVAEGLYETAVLNEDGSVNYTMTKQQQEARLAEMTILYDDSIAEMTDEEDSGILEITHDRHFSSFEVILSSGVLPKNEAFITANLLYMGRMFTAFHQTPTECIEVVYLDQNTETVIAQEIFSY